MKGVGWFGECISASESPRAMEEIGNCGARWLTSVAVTGAHVNAHVHRSDSCSTYL